MKILFFFVNSSLFQKKTRELFIFFEKNYIFAAKEKNIFMKNFLLLILFIFSFHSFSQNSTTNKIDSLLSILQKSQEDSNKVLLLNDLAFQYLRSDTKKAMKFATGALELSNKLKFTKGIGVSYRNIGSIYTVDNQFEEALKNYFSSLEIYNEINDFRGIATVYNNIGIVYSNQGNYELSIENSRKALQIYESLNDSSGIGKSFGNIGRLYLQKGDYMQSLDNFFKGLKIQENLKNKEILINYYNGIGSVLIAQKKHHQALEYFEKSLKIATELKQKLGIASAHINIGQLLYQKQEYEKSIENYEKALILYEELKLKRQISMCYNNLGEIYNILKNYEKDLVFYEKSLKIREETKDKKGIAICYEGIGKHYLDTKSLGIAVQYLTKALNIAQEISALDIINGTAKKLSQANAEMGNFQQAYEFHALYKNTSDSLFNKNMLDNSLQLSMQYEFDKKQKEQELEQKRQREVQEKEIQQQRLLTLFFISLFGLMAVLAVIIFRNNRIQRKTNRQLAVQKIAIEFKNNELHQKNVEIEAQRDEIENQNVALESQRDLALCQKEEIEQQKKEITDSIRYAQRIQMAILPQENVFENVFEKYFILFKPRDIVSGDFYWATTRENKIFIAAADCTGHGVPGAFMSMLGISFLNEIVNKNNITQPAEILNRLRENIIATLQQTGKRGEQQDGMDIALCSINKENNILEYSGAYNSLYLFRKLRNLNENESDAGHNIEFTETKADRMPIGIYIKETKPFTNNVLTIQKDDAIYLFSDGYLSQFGGLNGSKFKGEKFKTTLRSLQNREMPQQKEILEKMLREWQGELPQTDDILVIGIKL